MGLPRAIAAIAVFAALVAGGTTLASGATKPVKCKSGQVKVRVGETKLKCMSFKSVLPAPKKIDIRVAHLQEALKFDPYKGRGQKGKRRPRRVANTEKKANKRFLKVLPDAVALADRLTKANPRAVARAFCNLQESTPTGETGGVKVTGMSGTNGDGGVMEYSPGGVTVRTTYSDCRHGGFSIPACPTATGVVESGTGTRSFNVTEEIRDGDRVLSRKSYAYEDQYKARGHVGADGKLNDIDVEITQDVLIIATGGIAQRAHATRPVTVAMPSGLYFVEGGATPTLTGATGALQDGSSFSSLVEGIISSYREAEKGWSSFDHQPYCAEPTFDPESDAVKVKKGQAGTLKIYAKARSDGGKATEAHWTLTNPSNGDFSPPSSDQPQPSVNYTVHTSAPSGGKIKVTVRVTSTAGVGEKEWTEDIVGTRIDGTMSGYHDPGHTRLDWEGNIAFERDPADPADMGGANGTYLMEGADYTVTASGTGDYGCTVRGVQHFALAPHNVGGMSVLGQGANFGPPYQYTWFAGFPGHPTMNVVLENCPHPDEGHNGEVVEIDAQVVIGDHGGATSADGITFADSWTQGDNSVTWSFGAKD